MNDDEKDLLSELLSSDFIGSACNTYISKNSFLNQIYGQLLNQLAVPKSIIEGDNNKMKKELKYIADLFEVLSNPDIESIEVYGTDNIEITLKDDRIYDYVCVFEEEKVSVVSYLVKTHLNRNQKTTPYLISKCNDSEVMALNIKNMSFEKMVRNSDINSNYIFKKDAFSDNVTMLIKGTVFILTDPFIVSSLFEYVPEIKMNYLKMTKSLIDHAKKEIEMAENREIYKITDEDRLIMEVMDNE